MSGDSKEAQFTRRERQLMDIVHARGESSAREILAEISDPPGYSSVRRLLGILVEKGHLKQRSEGKRLIYSPTQARGRAARGALQKLLDVFYDGSVEEAVSGLISMKRNDLDSEQLERLAEMIEEARTTTEPQQDKVRRRPTE